MNDESVIAESSIDDNRLPHVTDDEICLGLLAGEAVAVTAYQWRTGVAWSDAEAAVRAALDDAMSGRREPEEVKE